MSDRTWLYVVDGVSAGPVAEPVLVQLAAAGHVDGSTLVWSDGMDEWAPLSVLGIPGVSVESAPVLEQNALSLPVPDGPSRWATGAFYLGWLSVLVLPGPLAVVVAAKALQHMRRFELRTGIRPRGAARALFGVAMGTLATTLLVWVIVTAAIA